MLVFQVENLAFYIFYRFLRDRKILALTDFISLKNDKINSYNADVFSAPQTEEKLFLRSDWAAGRRTL